MITRDEILMGKETKLSSDLEANLEKLLRAPNKVRKAYGKPMVVTSGLRTMEEHIRIYKEKAAKAGLPFDESKIPWNSAHLNCMAADFKDADGSLDKFCKENQKLLRECGLWQESPDATVGWCHLDIKKRAEKSGKYPRIFLP